jgi:hypothetical protein
MYWVEVLAGRVSSKHPSSCDGDVAVLNIHNRMKALLFVLLRAFQFEQVLDPEELQRRWTSSAASGGTMRLPVLIRAYQPLT